MKSFLVALKDDIFNQELSYDSRRIKFTEVCLANISVFNAMFQLHHKHKDDVEKFFDIVENPSSILNRHLKRNEKLSKFNFRNSNFRKICYSEKIDALVQDLFFVK